MTNPDDPTIITVEDLPCENPFAGDWLDENRHQAAERVKRIAPRFAAATVTEPAVRQWVDTLVRDACDTARVVPNITTGRSLFLSGPTGVGKTHQAVGALRALAVSGVRCGWLHIRAVDYYDRLRPHSGVNTESEFARVAAAPVLVFDDLGVAPMTEWIAEQNYRLVDRRYEMRAPTIFTSNLNPRDITAKLGERVSSRIAGMCTLVILKGKDRRKVAP